MMLLAPARRLAVLSPLFVGTLVLSTSAQAMNQEGHDDWMVDLPQAIEFWEALPEARPLPSRRCPVTPEMVAKNPYEQIPLTLQGCSSAELGGRDRLLTDKSASMP